MGQLLYVGAALLGLAALMLIAQYAADKLARWPLFNLKPFNCATCLTFWLTALYLFCALAGIGYDRPATQLIEWHLIALSFAFINYFYIKSKFKIT